MDWGLFIVPGIIVFLFLAVLGLTWWTSHSKSYREWELRDLERWTKEQESRPKPSWADDPIAQRIEWTGTAAWGADLTANPKGAVVRIRSVRPERIEFHPGSARAWHKAMLFLSAVAGVLIFSETGSIPKALLAPLFFGGLSVLVWLVRLSTWEALVFDKRLGIYWRGKDEPSAPAAAVASSHRLGRISDIYALQLISTRRYVGNPRMGADSERKEFPTHELALVLRDATRVSIVMNDDYGGIERDAKTLARFLQRPLWKPHG